MMLRQQGSSLVDAAAGTMLGCRSSLALGENRRKAEHQMQLPAADGRCRKSVFARFPTAAVQRNSDARFSHEKRPQNIGEIFAKSKTKTHNRRQFRKNIIVKFDLHK